MELSARKDLPIEGSPPPRPAAAGEHSMGEDLLALVTGAALAAMGVALFKQAGLLTGGTVGLALLLSYTSGWSISLTLLLCNAPFYVLGALRMGFAFTSKSLLALGLTAGFLHFMPRLIAFDHVSPWAAAGMGGLLAGIGMLVLFRHRASLGGLNILVLLLQDKLGWSAGRVQLALDAAILGGSALALSGSSLPTLACSLFAAVVLNLVLMVNHRPGRYRAHA
jgi:uncharacterized membrane-anchored protein YitT (DUF2179 family)